ncbi:DNA-directed RNA polymerase subunit omega [Caldalkalibacillus salinus]|uniref:DNA-directed RNA polymerase subunit omega n=1 Tax=Caldalkalibacillus salinus TaxID=2803787 RepID=UPI001921D904|nr:DNA-directed RNA polymerase subunit omega [Caldalkalibacillus salinus]
MLYPSIDDLLQRVDSKYKLVALAARRARELRERNDTHIEDPQSNKLVGVSLEEILEGAIEVGDNVTEKKVDEVTEAE